MTTYVNVRTEETRIVVTNNEGRVFPNSDPPPVGAHFPNPKHSAKRQAWDCLNHEAQWLPYYYLKVFQKARDAGLSLERLWLVLEDLVEKIERRATYADGADLLDYKCLDAAEFMAGPRWNDEEPDFSTARQLTGRHASPQLERGAYHTLAEIRAAVARGDPMYVAPALPPPLED